MQITGTIKEIFETVQVTEKFRKREFVIVTAETYPQEIKCELKQDNCGIIDAFGVGQTVDVFININGRAWTNPQGEVKYFVSIEAWRVLAVNGQSNDSAPRTPDELSHKNEANDDDLPF